MTKGNEQRKKGSREEDRRAPSDPKQAADPDELGPVPDLIRKLAALGLSGFFTTENALRRALGDTVPKEWADFAADQSERTRIEMLDRLSSEIGRVMENVEFGDVLANLLEGRSIEINAKIRLTSLDESPAGDPRDVRGDGTSSERAREKRDRGARTARSTRGAEINFKVSTD